MAPDQQKPALVADISNIIPGAEPALAYSTQEMLKAARRQASVLPEGADQRLFAQRSSGQGRQ